MNKKSKIILLILHIICVVCFAAFATHCFYIKDTVSGGFSTIAALSWLGCTVFDIVDLRRLSSKNKESK